MDALKKLRRIPEYLILCLGYILIPLLPRRAVVAAAAGLGSLAFRVCRGQRRVALANLDIAFGSERSAQEKRLIVRDMYRVFAGVILDVFWFGLATRRRIARWVTRDNSFDAYFKAKPALAVTAHFGNWEVMGEAVAIWGTPCVSVAAQLDNSLADRLLVRRRTGAGQGVTNQKGAVSNLMNCLRGGTNVALLVDQNVLPHEGGEFVDFFGLPAPASRAPVVLARRTGATVVLVYCVAEKDGRYRVFASLPRGGGEGKGDGAPRTRDIAAAIEQVIRKHPEQWLWIYKRWKYIPDDRSEDEYPFYARRSSHGRPLGESRTK